MKRVGDDQAGFSVAFDTELGAVRVRGWGFWSVEVATAFAKTVGDVCHTSPKGSALLMEMTGLKPMRDEGQQSFGALVAALPKLGIARTTVTTDSPLTKLQLLRLASEHAIKGSIEVTASAADPIDEILTQGQTMLKERTSK
jgi:hypothetical protein